MHTQPHHRDRRNPAGCQERAGDGSAKQTAASSAGGQGQSRERKTMGQEEEGQDVNLEPGQRQLLQRQRDVVGCCGARGRN